MTEHEVNGASVDDVVRQLGITPRTLRYYEEVGLIPPPARTSGGHRMFDQDTVDRLKHVIRLKENLGFSLQEIRNILDAVQFLEELRTTFRQSEHDPAHRRTVIDTYIDTLQGLIQTMDAKLESLSTMRAAYHEKLERSIRYRDENL